MRILCIAALCAGLGGCVTQAETVPDDPMIFGRADCQRAEGNPVIQQDAEQVKQICLGRAQAAAVAGTANMPAGYGLGGAIAAGIAQGAAANQITSATVNSCMAEHGWLFKRKSEHIAMCDAIREQQRVAALEAAKPPTKRRSTARPASVQVPPVGAARPN
jgi:hypothetical protein